jgi:glycerol-1-phosphatase
VAADLRSLLDEAGALRVAPHPAWRVEVGPRAVTVHSTGRETQDPLTVVRATASAVWHAGLDGLPFAVTGGDSAAHDALERWSLLRAPDQLA